MERLEHDDINKRKKEKEREKRRRRRVKCESRRISSTIPRSRGQSVVPLNQPRDVCPRLVVRVRVSASSLYRGNQIARHKFRLYVVMRVKVTTAKLARIEKEAQRGLTHARACVCAGLYTRARAACRLRAILPELALVSLRNEHGSSVGN